MAATRSSCAQRNPSGLNITASYAYDEFGNVTSTTDPLGNTTTMTVNRLNQVTQVVAPSPLSYTTEFEYDASDNLVKTQTQNGAGQGSGNFQVFMEYDLLDNLTKKIADIDGSTTATTEYFYDKDDKLTRVKAPHGNETKWVYNALDLNTSVIAGYGASEAATYTYVYDGNFRLIKIEEPLGTSYKTEYEYDHHDRTTKVKNALGHYVKSVFGSDHILDATESYTSGNVLLAKSTYAYDSGNRLTKTEVLAKDDAGTNIGDGFVTSTIVYDANSNVITTKDENDHETKFTYDSADRVSIVEDPVGSKVTFTYDANSNVLTKKLEEKQEGISGFDTYLYKFEYDKLNRLTQTTDPGSFSATFTYDARNLVTTTDPLGNKVFLKYDELNRNIERNVEYSGSSVITTKWEFDKNGRLTKLIDPRSKATTYAYDALDRVITETYADATTKSFTYDANSNIAQVIDQNATTVMYAYDTLNRLTQKTFDIQADHIKGEQTAVDFAYDALNRLVEAKDTDSRVLYTYNTLSGVESEEMRYGAGTLNTTGKIVKLDYDDQGRVSMCHYPGSTSSSGQLEYTYDVLNRLSMLERKTGATTRETLGAWTFKGPSRVIKKSYGNGTWTDVAYNARGLVESVNHKKPDGADPGTDPDKILECGYAYDDAGKVKSEALVHYKNDGTIREDAGFTYLYDKADRLTKLYRGVPQANIGQNPPSVHTKKVEYTFDAASNRQTVATTPSGQSTYNDVYTTDDTNSYTAVNFAGAAVQYQFDAAGNRTYTDEGAKVWYYDYQNHVVEIRVDEESNEFVAYDHDALGRRFAKHFNHDGLRYEANKFFYYLGAALIQEYDEDANDSRDLEIEYFWGQSLAEPVHIRTYDAATPSAFVQAGYYHQNVQGSVYAISGTGSGSNLIENYRYTEYGEVTVNAGDTNTGGATPFGNKWAWQCHYYDFEVTNVASGVALYGHSGAYDPELATAIARSLPRPASHAGATPSTMTASEGPSIDATVDEDNSEIDAAQREADVSRYSTTGKAKSPPKYLVLVVWKSLRIKVRVVPQWPIDSKSEAGPRYILKIKFVTTWHSAWVWVTAAQILAGDVLPPGTDPSTVIPSSVSVFLGTAAAKAVAAELRNRGMRTVDASTFNGQWALSMGATALARARVRGIQKMLRAKRANGAFAYVPEVLLLFRNIAADIVHTDVAIRWGDGTVTVFETGRDQTDGVSVRSMSDSAFTDWVEAAGVAFAPVRARASGDASQWDFAVNLGVQFKMWDASLNIGVWNWSPTSNKWDSEGYHGTCASVAGTMVRAAGGRLPALGSGRPDWISVPLPGGGKVSGYTGGLYRGLERGR